MNIYASYYYPCYYLLLTAVLDADILQATQTINTFRQSRDFFLSVNLVEREGAPLSAI